MGWNAFHVLRRAFPAVLCAGLLLLAAGGRAQDKASPAREQIPERVREGLKARFPTAEIDKWTKEKEGEMVVYDIEFTQGGLHFEADVEEDGTMHNWEKAIAAKELPAAVVKAVDRKHPKATISEVMQVTTVKNGKDQLEGYEIVLQTSDKKNVEVMVAPDGKVLEESGVEK